VIIYFIKGGQDKDKLKENYIKKEISSNLEETKSLVNSATSV